MKTQDSKARMKAAVFAAALLASCLNLRSADTSITLKDALQDHFRVGTAVNRSIVTGTSTRRSPELLRQDIALVTQQFNQLVAENDMKWALIHPRPGPDGYEFGPADALVEFGLRHNMELAGHTLVWHSQTPNWVFAGTQPPPTQAESAPSGPRRGPGRYTGPRASREELLERMREHVHTVVGRYRGKVKVWDVVNEAISDSGPNLVRNTLWLERGATAARESTDALKQAGINSHYYESPETAHEWQSWRRSLYQMAPLLFRNEHVLCV